MASTPAPEEIGALWLQTLQRAMQRGSHDVKDALNGVSVNLEVIRSRSARPDVPASAVTQFGDAAAQQLERLTILIEAVLVLSRPERSPADVGLTLRGVTTLCSASASSSDAAVRMIDDVPERTSLTRARSDAVRLALLAPMLDVVAGSGGSTRASEVTCTLRGDDDAVLIVIAAADRRAVMPDRIADVVRSAGIRWTDGEQHLSLAFPRA